MKAGNKFLIIMLIVIVGLSFLVFYKVDEREHVVITQFGQPVKTITEPGLYYIWPDPVQTVNRFEKRLMLYKTRLIEYLTQDKKNIIVQCFVCWRIDEPLEFFQAIGNNISAAKKIDDIVCAQIGSILGNYEMSSIISIEKDAVKIKEIEKAITESSNKKTMDSYGIEIKEIGICRLALPQDNVESVYKRMKSERESIANKYRAEGKEKADIIRSEANKTQSNILSEAYKDAEIIKGEGDAAATKIYAEAFEKDSAFYKFIRTLESYKKIIDDKTTVVLSSKSDLLKYLNRKTNKADK